MCKKLNAEKESSTPAKEKKCKMLLLSLVFSLSLSLSYYKNTVIRSVYLVHLQSFFTLSCLKCTFETNPTSVRTSPSLSCTRYPARI